MSRGGGRGRGRGGGGAFGHGSALLQGLTFDEIKGQARTGVTYPPSEKELETQEANRQERKMVEANAEYVKMLGETYAIGPEGLSRNPNPKIDPRMNYGVSKDFMPLELWNALFETDKTVRDTLKKKKKAKGKGKRSERSEALIAGAGDETGEAKVDPAGDKDSSEAEDEEGSQIAEEEESEEEEDDYDNNYFDNGEEEEDAGGGDEGGVMD